MLAKVQLQQDPFAIFDTSLWVSLIVEMESNWNLQVQVGFFADAGPLQLFISNHLIPEDFEFNATGEPAFVSTDEAVRVQAGAEVRLRIVGTRMDASEIVSWPFFINLTLSLCNVHLLQRQKTGELVCESR